MKPTKDSNNSGTLFYRTNRYYYSVKLFFFSIWQTEERSPLIQLSARRCVGVLIQCTAVHIVVLFAVYEEDAGKNSFV